MAGTFGYELDITKLSAEEKRQVRKQIHTFKEYYDLIQHGEYYRLQSPADSQCTVWETAEPEGREALISAVYHHVESNAAPIIVKLRGLKEESRYQVELKLDHLPDECRDTLLKRLPLCFREGETVTGAALQQVGLVIPDPLEDYGAWQIHICEQENGSIKE